jgi:hypothetical protein
LNSLFTNQVILFAISNPTQFHSHKKNDQYETQSSYSSHNHISIRFQSKSFIQISVYVFSLKCEVHVLSTVNHVHIFSYSSKEIDKIFQSIISQFLFKPLLDSVYLISDSDNHHFSESIAKPFHTNVHVKVLLNLISILSIFLFQLESKYFNSTAFKEVFAKIALLKDKNIIKNQKKIQILNFVKNVKFILLKKVNNNFIIKRYLVFKTK